MTRNEYLIKNPIFKTFYDELIQYLNKNLYKSPGTEHSIMFTVGNKFIKITVNNQVWCFISRYTGIFAGEKIKAGDLMKPASYSRPAKHSRGSIIDGTASYKPTGPTYLI